MRNIPRGTPVKLLFQDEARFGRISDTRRCWTPMKKRPVVGQQVIREYLYAVAAVNPLEGEIVPLVMPWVDAEVMSIFLSHTSENFPEAFCLMFLDGAGWHKAKELKIPNNIKLLPLPPYSPELNPIEHVWDFLRENAFGNKNFNSLDEVEDTLCSALQYLIQHPSVVKSLTCFSWINPLCMTSN